MRGNSHVRCGVGENLEINSKSYLSLLTGDVASWNNSKRSEESERVKHNVLA